MANSIFTNNKFSKASGKDFVSLSPNNGKSVFEGNYATLQECNTVICNAKSALNDWSSLAVSERVEYIKKFVEIVKENKEDLALIISKEVGKPIWESQSEIQSIINKLEPTLDAYNKRCAQIVREAKISAYTRFKPLGVIVVIGPYNYPMHMTNGHIMAGLIAGNTIVLKPSDKAPLCATKIMECWHKAGLPNGVINMVQGDGETVKHLVKNKNVKGICFTGSYKVGQIIRKYTTSEQLLAMEMGGDNPIIVWDSKNIQSAVYTVLQSAFGTAGQKCVSARRCIVPNNDFGDKFIECLVDTAKKMVVAPYTSKEPAFCGPLRTPLMVDNALNLQNLLAGKGAKVLLEAKKLRYGDCFISPCIIDTTCIKRALKEEVFAPFLQIKRVNTFEQALKEANNTEYGLASSIITESQDLYNKFFEEIESGIINWNRPTAGSSAWASFGGIKQSGNFRSSGYFAADFCSYPVGSSEISKLEEMEAPKGIKV